MNILGLMGTAGHDPAVCVIKSKPDGTFDCCTIAEERLNRIKYSYHFPLRSLDYCLNALSLRISDIDLVVSDWTENTTGFASNDSYRRLEFDFIRRHLKIPKDRIHLIPNHHLAHAYTAFMTSGFDDSAILIVDGTGSALQGTTIFAGQGQTIDLVETNTSYSLGKLYDAITRKVLNFGIGEDGKTMGLAAFGEKFPDHPPILKIQGRYTGTETDLSRFMTRNPDNRILRDDIQVCRDKKDLYGPYFSRIAFEVQDEVERAMLAFAKYARQVTGSRRLCIAGGVGLNCVANEKIIQSKIFDEVYIFPASSDVGIPFGLALYGYYELAGGRERSTYRPTYHHAYVGQSYERRGITEMLDRYHIPYRSMTKLEVAERIARQEVVGWHVGGSEFGPRALGHRSIVADPRVAEIKTIMNAKVKHREAYRPFAPSVLEEFAQDYFVMEGNSPFMLRAPYFRPEKTKEVPAVVHVDGSGRVQTVSRKNCPEFYELIAAFKELTGVPILLNTSFNDNDEPIVETPMDALICFLRTQIDWLVFDGGAVVVEKATIADRAKDLATQLAAERKASLEAQYKDLLAKFVSTYSVRALKNMMHLHAPLASHQRHYSAYRRLKGRLRTTRRFAFVGDEFHWKVCEDIMNDLFGERQVVEKILLDDALDVLPEVRSALARLEEQGVDVVLGLYNCSEHLRQDPGPSERVHFIYESWNSHLQEVFAPIPSGFDLGGIEAYSCEYQGRKDFDVMFR